MTRTCKCGERFEPKGDWQRKCWDCWRAAKDADEIANAYQDGFSAGVVSARRASSSASLLGVDDLRLLVRLIHPDMHPPERFELANRATALINNLITQRKR